MIGSNSNSNAPKTQRWLNAEDTSTERLIDIHHADEQHKHISHSQTIAQANETARARRNNNVQMCEKNMCHRLEHVFGVYSYTEYQHFTSRHNTFFCLITNLLFYIMASEFCKSVRIRGSFARNRSSVQQRVRNILAVPATTASVIVHSSLSRKKWLMIAGNRRSFCRWKE